MWLVHEEISGNIDWSEVHYVALHLLNNFSVVTNDGHRALDGNIRQEEAWVGADIGGAETRKSVVVSLYEYDSAARLQERHADR